VFSAREPPVIGVLSRLAPFVFDLFQIAINRRTTMASYTPFLTSLAASAGVSAIAEDFPGPRRDELFGQRLARSNVTNPLQ